MHNSTVLEARAVERADDETHLNLVSSFQGALSCSRGRAMIPSRVFEALDCVVLLACSCSEILHGHRKTYND